MASARAAAPAWPILLILGRRRQGWGGRPWQMTSEHASEAAAGGCVYGEDGGGAGKDLDSADRISTGFCCPETTQGMHRLHA